MKRYVGLVLVAATLWGGWWAVQAYSMRAEVAGWFEDRRAEGWQADYDNLQVRGFPSRVDVTLTNPRLLDPERGTGWQSPFLQILGLSYQRDHVIVAFADSQSLILPDGPVQVTSDGLRMSLVTEDAVILRMNMQAETLNIAGADGQVALAGVLANFHQMADARYRVTVAAQAIATPQGALGSGRSDGLDLRAEVGFDTVWTLDALRGPRPQPREVDLEQAAYRHDGLELNVAGAVTADAQGRMDGALTVRAVNWQALLDQAQQSGALPQGLADTLSDALSLAAGLNGRRDTLDLPLRFSRGEVAFGIIPLGRAPRLVLP